MSSDADRPWLDPDSFISSPWTLPNKNYATFRPAPGAHARRTMAGAPEARLQWTFTGSPKLGAVHHFIAGVADGTLVATTICMA